MECRCLTGRPLTEAGERLLGRVGLAAGAITESLDEPLPMGAQPGGTLPLLVQRFRREHPGVRVEITVEDDRGSLVGADYGGGVRIGEYIERDRVAVRVSRSLRWRVFGAPDYFKSHGRPKVPEEVARHECICCRRPEVGDIDRWKFERWGQALAIDAQDFILVNDGGRPARTHPAGPGAHLHRDAQRGWRARAEHRRAGAGAVLSRRGCDLHQLFPPASGNQPKLRALVESCTRGL